MCMGYSLVEANNVAKGTIRCDAGKSLALLQDRSRLLSPGISTTNAHNWQRDLQHRHDTYILAFLDKGFNPSLSATGGHGIGSCATSARGVLA